MKKPIRVVLMEAGLRIVSLPIYLIAGLLTITMSLPAILMTIAAVGLAVGAAAVVIAGVIPVLAVGIVALILVAVAAMGVAVVTKHKERLKEIAFMLIVVNTLRLWLRLFFPDHWWIDTILVVLLTLGYCWFTISVDFTFRFTIRRHTLTITNCSREDKPDDRR